MLIRINRHLAAPEKYETQHLSLMFPVSTHNHLSHYHFSYDRIAFTQVLKNNTNISPFIFCERRKTYGLLYFVPFLKSSNYINKTWKTPITISQDYRFYIRLLNSWSCYLHQVACKPHELNIPEKEVPQPL